MQTLQYMEGHYISERKPWKIVEFVLFVLLVVF